MNALNRRGIARNAAEGVFARTIGNIFVQSQLGPSLRQKKIAVLCRKIERELAKKKNFSAFERLAIGASLSLGLLGLKPADGHLIIFD